MSEHPIVVVSGLPRSGTSMMMKMLEAGGLPVLTDNLRAADEDNPRGYFEFERVKRIQEDPEWLPEAQGKVVKMISALLKHLPSDYRYRIIFMRRDMGEILASQRQMLVRRGEETERVDDKEMARLFARHLSQLESWLASQPHMDVLYVHYGDVVAAPAAAAAQVNAFLGGGLDEIRMAQAVDPALYRQKA
jgi:hypothetical protein